MPGEPWDATFASLIAIPGRFSWFWGTFCMHWRGGVKKPSYYWGKYRGKMPSVVLSPQLGWERNNQCASRPGCAFAGITIGWKNPACRMSDFGQGDRLLSSRLSPRVRLLNTLRLADLFIFFIFFFPPLPFFPIRSRSDGAEARQRFSPRANAPSPAAALQHSPRRLRSHGATGSAPSAGGGHTRC